MGIRIGVVVALSIAILTGAVASLHEPLGPTGPTPPPRVASAGWTSTEAAGRYPLWVWPMPGARKVTAPYRAPAHDYAAGHRGMDVTGDGAEVTAPADGVVAFRGTVVDRPLLTIEHSGGFVSTFEPLASTLSPGDVVAAGDVIGVVATGGHAVAGTLHVGVRFEGDYMNPLLLFGGLPRAVLLPCCSAL